MRFIPRKSLPHTAPPWVTAGALFFVTLRCDKTNTVDLTTPTRAKLLLEAAAHYHEHHRWFARLFLLMPDHVHALLAFPSSESMRKCMQDWKRYTARTVVLSWQRDFFDHRIRDDESWELKADYIRQNPVRKGLVCSASEWPWIFEA
jgi:putative transposase